MITADLITKLASYQRGWDTHDGAPIGAGALNVLRALHVSPLSDGGVQIEIHAEGWEAELAFNADGKPTCVSMEER